MIYLYIIGPVTGMLDKNRPAFFEAASSLRFAGYKEDLPHRWVIPGTSWEEAMTESIRRMMGMWANSIKEGSEFGIAMLPGWEDSKGAKIEHDLAVALGIPCKPWREWLNERLPA